MTQYWLIKSEPSSYSWERMKHDKTTLWDGVRNYQARNNLKEMKKGDLAFFYHSVKDPAIQGIVEVTRTFYPDPTNDDLKTEWVVVDVTYKTDFKNIISLLTIKADPFFSDFKLVQQSRLSVVPVPKIMWDRLVEMGMK
jgi:predicted RNA-binding protein with PUA-like domain